MASLIVWPKIPTPLGRVFRGGSSVYFSENLRLHQSRMMRTLELETWSNTTSLPGGQQAATLPKLPWQRIAHALTSSSGLGYSLYHHAGYGVSLPGCVIQPVIAESPTIQPKSRFQALNPIEHSYPQHRLKLQGRKRLCQAAWRSVCLAPIQRLKADRGRGGICSLRCVSNRRAGRRRVRSQRKSNERSRRSADCQKL
jgi:hypothetical protein